MHVQHCAHSHDHSLPSDTQIYSVHLSLKHLQVQVGTYKNDDTAACLEAKSLYCLSRNFACVEDMEDSSLLVVLLGGALVVILNNQDLMLCARPFVHFLLVIQCSSPSSSNDQKSTQDLASLFALALLLLLWHSRLALAVYSRGYARVYDRPWLNLRLRKVR